MGATKNPADAGFFVLVYNRTMRFFNETFFKFLLGFIALVLASLVLLAVASMYLGDGTLAEDEPCLAGPDC